MGFGHHLSSKLVVAQKINILLTELYTVPTALGHLYDFFFLLMTKCTFGGRSKNRVARANVWVARAKEWVAVASPPFCVVELFSWPRCSTIWGFVMCATQLAVIGL